jgi:2,4-dienoyl-CoA reductase-like NADH-dependent reductase (Old Yellow Enzyme family)
VGDGYPVLAKINADDYLEGGLGIDDMLQVAGMLEQSGVDAIELSGGTILALYIGSPNTSFSRTERKGLYYEGAAKRYKEEIGVPLILVGGIRSYPASLRLVEQGITDYVSMCRPLIREPDLVKRWESGDTRASACVSDNACLQQGLEGKGVHCVHVDS